MYEKIKDINCWHVCTFTVVTFSCIINKWRTFIISQINHNLCLCTQVDLNVCANSNISGGPPASTCVYQFFYEYEKNCKGTQLPILKDGTSHDMQTTMLNKNQQTMQRINDSHLKENESRPSFILKQEDMYKPTIKTFFHPHQLVVGDQISFPLISNNIHNSQGFLPQSLANMFPFDSKNLFKLLSLLNVPINSSMADNMAQTLEFCDKSNMGGDTMQCATSIESMVDFVFRTLGNKVMVWTPNLENVEHYDYSNRHQVTINEIVNITRNLKDVATTTCHNLVYPYLVYGCHTTTSTSVLSVSFKEAQGHALVVCHHNTSAWNTNLPLENFTHIQTMEKGFAIGFLTITSFGHLMYSLPKFAFKIDYLY